MLVCVCVSVRCLVFLVVFVTKDGVKDGDTGFKDEGGDIVRASELGSV